MFVEMLRQNAGYKPILSISELMNKKTTKPRTGTRPARRSAASNFQFQAYKYKRAWSLGSCVGVGPASSIRQRQRRGRPPHGGGTRWAPPIQRGIRPVQPETPLFVLLNSLRNIGPVVKGKEPKPGRIFLPSPPPLQKKHKTCILVASSHNDTRETDRWIKQAHCIKPTYRS